MLSFRLFAVGALLAGALLAENAEAVLRPNTLVLNPRAGTFLFEKREKLENAPVFSLGVGYRFSSNWSSELNGAYLETIHDNGEEEVKGYVGRMEVLYHFRPWSNLVPHLAAGLGFLALDRSGSINAEGFAGYGVGLQYFITPAFSLNLDGRHQLRDSNDFTASAGLGFCLAGEENPKLIDTDGDGVIDAFDRCPGTRLGVPVDGYGCATDCDRDGVSDYQDKCSDTPPAAGVDADGCPRDTDRDGVADHLDSCSGTAGGLTVNQSGCPAEKADFRSLPIFNSGSIVFSLPFAPGATELLPEFEQNLRQAIIFLQSHPGAAFVVEAHTDGIGSADRNLRLSRARAEGIREYLIKNGPVAPEQITAQGFGESRPVADEGTQHGRERNRRIIIRLKEEG